MAGNKQYLRGTAKERELKIDLEEQGYSVVRSSGSHGAWDLCAIKDNENLFIQCKRELNKGQTIKPENYKKDIDQLKKLATQDQLIRKVLLYIWLDRVGWHIYQVTPDETKLIKSPASQKD